MKKITLLLATLLIGSGAFAQCAANFIYIVNPANNGSVQFINNSTSTTFFTNFDFDFGDASLPDTATSPTHIFSTGTYYVCLTLFDSIATCSSTFCDSVTVINNSPPTCSANFTISDSLSTGIHISNYSSGSNLIYNWDFGDGNTSTASGYSLFHNYASAGVYTVCLTITNAAGTCNSSYCDTALISSCHAGYTIVLDSIGNGITFTSTTTGAPTTYNWNFSDGTISSLANPHHVFALNGSVWACLTVSSATDSACSDTYCSNLWLNGNCNAHFNAYADSSQTVQFYNSSSGPSMLNCLWDFGDGNTSNDSSNYVAHQYATGGTYMVCLTVSNTVSACSDTYCDTVSISSCSVGFSSVNDATGNGITFTSTAGGTPDTYNWSFGDGNTSTQVNPYHVYSTAGYYNVSLTVSSSVDSACSATASSYVLAGAICNANFSIDQDSLNLYNYTIYNYASGNGIITNYLWDFGDSTTSTLPYPQHTYAYSVPLTICLTITTANGCTATHCDSITPGLAPNHIVTITVINPATVGIKEHSTIAETLDNYPNPFGTSTTITYSTSRNSSIELCLYDLLGNKITTIENGNKTSGNYKTTLDASGIASGIYFLQLKTDNKVLTKKLIITK